ncbi:MAG: hypothetical protein EBV31_00425 [Verrucomicrobia bacterium]|nr:hypothetical protein [Verrucomicrobiota bacterium]
MVAATLLVVGSATAPKAEAANLYWDFDATSSGNNTTSGAGLGGAGAWTAGDLKWFDGTNDIAWNDANKDVAIFTGAGGSVALANGFTVGGLVFTGVTSGAFSLDGSTLTLAAPAGAVTPTISVTTGNRATISSLLAGASGFLKTGDGTLVLSNNGNTFTGDLAIRGGALVVTDPGQLGLGTTAISVFGYGNTGNPGFSGGSLVIQGASAANITGLTIAREVSGSGRGPGAANNAGAIMSLGSNTFSGGLTLGNGNEARFFASSGNTTLQGDTYLTGGNGMVFFGNGNIIASGVVSGMDTGYDRFIKTGLIYDTTLWLQNAGNSLVGTVRIDGGSIRVATNAALGLSLSDRAVDINNGRLEVRTDDPAGFATRKVYIRDNTNSNLYLDHALGSELVGQTVQFGQLRAFVINTLFHIYGRNGYGATFQPAAQGTLGYFIGGGGANGATINNYSNGLVTLNGDLWRQTDGTARTLTFGGNGDMLVTGSILAPTTIAHGVTKGGTGTLTLQGAAANFLGSFNVNGGTTAVRGMGAFNAAVASGALQLNSGAVSYLGAAGTGAGETTTKLLNLTGTTGAGFLYANQAGTAPTALILANGIAATGGGIKNFYLGGNASASVVNELRGVLQDNTTTNKTSLVKMGASTWLYVPAAASFVSTAPTGITVASGGAANTSSFVVSSATGIVPGMTVTGTNVPAGSIVTGVSGTTVYVNNAISTAITAATALTFGTIANFTGNVTVAGGTLQLRPTAATGGGSDLITNASTLTFAADAIQGAGLAGGVFEYQGSAAGGTLTETVGALSATAGLGVLRVTANGGTPTLNLASYASRSAGAALRLEPATGTGLQFAAIPTAVSAGVLSGAYFLSPSGALDFVGTPLTANANVAALGSATALANDGGSASGNFLQSSALTTTGVLAANTIRLSGASSNLTLGGALTLTSTSATVLGGILHDNALGAATIAGSTITTSTAGQELFLVTGGTANANALTVASVLANGAGGVTKAGSGLLVLTGSNSFTGAVTLDEGTLRVSGATTGLLGLPAAATVNALRPGTTLEISSAGASVAPYTGATALPTLITAVTNGSGTISVLTPGPQAIQFGGAANGTGTGVLTSVLADGAGKLSVIVKANGGVQVLAGLNTYTGATIVGSGTLAVTNLANIGQPSGIGAGDATSAATNAASLVLLSGARLLYTGNNVQAYDNRYLNLFLETQTASVATNRLFTMLGDAQLESEGGYGNNIQTASANRINNNASLVFTNTGAIQFGGNFTGTRTLTLQGNSTGDNRIDLLLTDSPDLVGKLAINRSGWNSWWILGNQANTYSGDTTLSGGALIARDGFSLPTASNLVFADYVGVFQSTGTFSRTLGAGAGQWRARATHGNAGFAADTAKFTVNWTPLANPVWSASAGGTANFLRGGSLVLNTSTSAADVEVRGNFVITPASGTSAAFPAIASGNTVTLSSGDVSNLAVGQLITGITGIPAGTYITGFNTGTQFTMSQNVSAATTAGTATISGGGWHDVNVVDNGYTGLDFATISGVISGTGIFSKQGGANLILGDQNTYSGNTILRNEGLVVTSIGAAGATATSLGTNVSGGWLELGNPGATNTVTLIYVGPGETTTRAIYLTGSSGTRRLEASGSGALVITNLINNTANSNTPNGSASTKTLELRGVNTDFNMITSTLTNELSGGNGALTVTKADGGVWVLNPSAANTFSGGLNANGGLLGLTVNGIGTIGTIGVSNGGIFAYGADLAVSKAISWANNSAFVVAGQYNLAITGDITKGSGNNTATFSNNLENGKVFTVTGNYVNATTATTAQAPTLAIRGTGSTVWNGIIGRNASIGGDTTLDIAIANDASLTLGGSSPNTYTGITYLSQGRLILNKVGALGPGGAAATPTVTTNTSTSLTAVSSTAGLQVGQAIAGTGIPAGATIVSVTANTITISAAATASATITATVTALAPSQFNFNGGILQAGLDLTGVNALPNPVFLNGDYATVTGTYGITFAGALTNYNSNRYLNNQLSGGAALNLTGTVNLSHDASGRILLFIGSGTTNISGVVKDSSSTGTGSSLYLRGATGAQLNLTATNTFTGNLLVERGTVTVSGSAGALNTILATAGSGAIVRAGGILTLDSSGANNAAGRLAGRGVLLEGGRLNMVSNAANSTETAAVLRPYGNATINLSGAGTNTLTFTSLDYTTFSDPRSALDVSATTGLASTNKLKFTNILGTAGTASLMPRFFVTGADFAAHDATNGVTTFAGYAAVTDITASAAGDVLKIGSAYAVDDITTDRTLRGLAVTDTTARTLGGAANNVLTISSGAILAAGGVTHTLSVPRLNFVTTPSVTTTNASANVTVASTAGFAVGQMITGTGIPANAFITGITNGTTFTISANATASGTVTATTYAPAFVSVDTGTTLDLTGAVVSNSDVTKQGAGTLLVSRKQYFGGQTTILGGTLKLGAGDNTLWAGGSNLLNVERNGTLDLNGTTQLFGRLISLGTASGGGGTITNTGASAANLVINTAGANQTFMGSLTGGNLSFTRFGGYTLEFGSAQTYGGATHLLGGTLTLRDDGALTGTSALTLNYATLAIDNNSNFRIQNNDRLPDAAPITMRGGSLTLQGLYYQAATETIGALTLAQGDNNITLSHAGGTFWSTDLTVASLTRSAGTTFNLTGNNQGLPGNATHLYFTSAPATVNRGMLGAWAIYNSTDYLAYNTGLGVGIVGTGGFVGYDPDFGAGKLTQVPVQTDTTTTLAANTTSAVLRLAGRSANNIAFAATNTVLNLELGGLLRSNDQGFASNIGTVAARGVLTAGGAATSGTNELVIYNAAAGSPSWGSAAFTTGSPVVTGLTTVGLYPGMTVTSGANIAASGVTILSVDGYNQVTLSANALATTTGQTITGGSYANGATTSGSAVVTITGGGTTAGVFPGMPISGTGLPVGTYVLSVDSATQLTLSKPATATAASGIAFTVGVSDVVVNAVIADNGLGNSVSLVKSGTGALDLTAVNTFTGGAVVNQGTLNLDPTVAGTAVLPAGTLTINGGLGGNNFAVVNANASGSIHANTDVVINGSGRLQYADNLTNTLKSVTFNNVGGEYGATKLSYLGVGAGSVLTFTSLTPITATSSNATIVSNLDAGRVILATGTNTLSIGALVIPGTAKAYTDLLPTLNITSVLTGVNVAVVKTGAGLLQLSGANEFAGGLDVQAGGIVLGANSTPNQGGVGFTGSPLGGAGVTMAAGTTLLVNNADRIVGNTLTFAGTPIFDNTGSGTMRTLTLNSTLNGLATGATTVQINSPWLTVALLGKIPNIASITGFNRTGLGRLIFNATGYTGDFNATALGLPTALSLLSDGNGTMAPETLALGNVVFDAGIVPNLTIGRAGGTIPGPQAANKVLATTSIANLGLGLTLTNNNGYGAGARALRRPLRHGLQQDRRRHARALRREHVHGQRHRHAGRPFRLVGRSARQCRQYRRAQPFDGHRGLPRHGRSYLHRDPRAPSRQYRQRPPGRGRRRQDPAVRQRLRPRRRRRPVRFPAQAGPGHALPQRGQLFLERPPHRRGRRREDRPRLGARHLDDRRRLARRHHGLEHDDHRQQHHGPRSGHDDRGRQHPGRHVHLLDHRRHELRHQPGGHDQRDRDGQRHLRRHRGEQPVLGPAAPRRHHRRQSGRAHQFGRLGADQRDRHPGRGPVAVRREHAHRRPHPRVRPSRRGQRQQALRRGRGLRRDAHPRQRQVRQRQRLDQPQHLLPGQRRGQRRLHRHPRQRQRRRRLLRAPQVFHGHADLQRGEFRRRLDPAALPRHDGLPGRGHGRRLDQPQRLPERDPDVRQHRHQHREPPGEQAPAAPRRHGQLPSGGGRFDRDLHRHPLSQQRRKHDQPRFRGRHGPHLRFAHAERGRDAQPDRHLRLHDQQAALHDRPDPHGRRRRGDQRPARAHHDERQRVRHLQHQRGDDERLRPPVVRRLQRRRQHPVGGRQRDLQGAVQHRQLADRQPDHQRPRAHQQRLRHGQRRRPLRPQPDHADGHRRRHPGQRHRHDLAPFRPHRHLRRDRSLPARRLGPDARGRQRVHGHRHPQQGPAGRPEPQPPAVHPGHVHAERGHGEPEGRRDQHAPPGLQPRRQHRRDAQPQRRRPARRGPLQHQRRRPDRAPRRDGREFLGQPGDDRDHREHELQRHDHRRHLRQQGRHGRLEPPERQRLFRRHARHRREARAPGRRPPHRDLGDHPQQGHALSRQLGRHLPRRPRQRRGSGHAQQRQHPVRDPRRRQQFRDPRRRVAGFGLQHDLPELGEQRRQPDGLHGRQLHASGRLFRHGPVQQPRQPRPARPHQLRRHRRHGQHERHHRSVGHHRPRVGQLRRLRRRRPQRPRLPRLFRPRPLEQSHRHGQRPLQHRRDGHVHAPFGRHGPHAQRQRRQQSLDQHARLRRLHAAPPGRRPPLRHEQRQLQRRLPERHPDGRRRRPACGPLRLPCVVRHGRP